MNRATFLIDGFNLYHSAKDVQRVYGFHTKWLDISSLCSSFLQWVSGHATLQEVYCFSAFAYHLKDPGVIARHQTYVKCLEATGIIKELGRFKPKQLVCPQYDSSISTCSNCNGQILRHEEKETDVAIASRLLELICSGSCDTIVLVTGDTDLAPAIRCARRLLATKEIRFIFPFSRKNNELARLAPSLTLKPRQYSQYQFPDPFILPDGTQVAKPANW